MRNIAVISPVAPGLHRKTIKEAVASSKKFPLHVVVLDGPGADPQIDREDGRVHVALTDTSVGRSEARNVGLQLAFSYGIEWSIFLDADDLLLETAWDDLQSVPGDVDVVYAEHFYRDTQTVNHVELDPELHKRLLQNPMMCKHILPNVSIMLKTERALRVLFDRDIAHGEHFDFFVRYVANPEIKAIKLQRPLIRVRPELSSSKFGPWADNAAERYKEWTTLSI